jgi:hypothetical protein
LYWFVYERTSLHSMVASLSFCRAAEAARRQLIDRSVGSRSVCRLCSYTNSSGPGGRTAGDHTKTTVLRTYALFAWLISHQPAVLFSQNKPATSNQPAVIFSQNKSAPAISHQTNEQAGNSRAAAPINPVRGPVLSGFGLNPTQTATESVGAVWRPAGCTVFTVC